MIVNQNWHNRIVTKLLYQAMGDLVLDARGDLRLKDTFDRETGKDLPKGIFHYGMVLATISRDGWELTSDGAQFILENVPPEGKQKVDRIGLVMISNNKQAQER